MEKRIFYLLFVALSLASFFSCGNKDYTEEERYLTKVYLKADYSESDTILKIVKAEKIRAYNPKLDENKKNMVLFGETSLKKYYNAAKLYKKGEVEADDVFKALRDAFSSGTPNTDALVVMTKIKGTDRYNFDILFSNDDVYYTTFTEVAVDINNAVYDYHVKEAKEKVLRSL